MDEIDPLNEIKIDSDSFRTQLEPYSIEQMEKYLGNNTAQIVGTDSFIYYLYVII